MRIALLCVLIFVLPARAALDPESWKPANEELRASVHPATSNLFLVFHTTRGLKAYAGNPKLDPSVVATEGSREKFIADMLASIEKRGAVLKGKEVKSFKGKEGLLVTMELPGGNQSTAFFCFSEGRLVNLTVLSKEKITWEDPDFVTLLNELPLGN